ncbi:MAG: FAD-dependent oxidoreductase [Verrucomicrobiota bacterium]
MLVPVIDCDVLVLGGGSAGIAAAITAARAGAKTLLLERHGSLGGMATAALVHSVCGLYFLPNESEPKLAHPGFPTEFAARLVSVGAASGPLRMGRVYVLPHSPPGFAAVCDMFISESLNLSTHLHSELIQASVVDGRLQHVEFSCRGVRSQVRARAWVDASGDAALCFMSGIDTYQSSSSSLQRPAFIFALQGVDVLLLDEQGRIRLAAIIATAVREGRLGSGALGTQVRATHRGSEAYVTIDLAGGANFDPTNPAQITELELEGRRLAIEIFTFLKHTHPALMEAHLSAFPARVGIRESRRLRGRLTITGDDVLRGTDSDESVALGTWPMENREKNTGPKWLFPRDNRPTQIPLGALHSAEVSNLWAAGRCISCDHEAQAAIRVMGTCMASGQAAGAAATIQASEDRRTAPSVPQVKALISKVARA